MVFYRIGSHVAWTGSGYVKTFTRNEMMRYEIYIPAYIM
jgi:hypothetical protein